MTSTSQPPVEISTIAARTHRATVHSAIARPKTEPSWVIQLNRTLARADLIIVGMLTIGVVGIILTTLLDWLEKKVVKGGRR